MSNLLIFPTHEMKYFGIYRNKVNFLFIFSVKGENNFSPVISC